MTSYCQYTPDKKEQSTQNQTKICAIIVFYVYFVLYIELLFGDVGLNGSLKIKNVQWTPYCPRTNFADKVLFKEENAMQYGSLVICSIRIDLLENTPGEYVYIVNLPKKAFRGINQTNINGKAGLWYLDAVNECVVLRSVFEAGIYYFSFTYLAAE